MRIPYIMMALAALCLGAALTGAYRKPAEPEPAAAPDEPLSMVESELGRARHLLGPDRVKVEVEDVAPMKPAEEIGALAGFGLAARNPDVMASVYVFEQWGGGRDALETLKAEPATEGMYVLHAINGRLLFFGYTRIDGPDGMEAKFRLSGLVSAFAGDE